MSAAEDSDNLLFMESSLITLSEAECRLAADLELYRSTMTPLIHAAAQRLMGNASPTHIIRQLLADSYLAQEDMRACVRHANQAYDAALALKRGLK